MSVCAERPCDADRGGNGDPAMDPSKRERRRTKNGQRRRPFPSAIGRLLLGTRSANVPVPTFTEGGGRVTWQVDA